MLWTQATSPQLHHPIRKIVSHEIFAFYIFLFLIFVLMFENMQLKPAVVCRNSASSAFFADEAINIGYIHATVKKDGACALDEFFCSNLLFVLFFRFFKLVQVMSVCNKFRSLLKSLFDLLLINC